MPERSSKKKVRKKSKKKYSERGVNEVAARILAESTEGEEIKITSDGKNAAAVALGRLGGLKGGKARAEKLTAEERSKIARNAAKIRWKKRMSDGST